MASSQAKTKARLGVRAAVVQTQGTQDPLTGRFTKLQGKIKEVNRDLAGDLAEEIARTLSFTRLESRRSAESGVLRKAILNPANRRADAFGFGVMIPEYMNQAAPYWALQNDGTSKFVGRTVKFIRGKGFGFPDPHNAGIREVKAQVRKEGARNYGQPRGELESGKWGLRGLAKQEGRIKRPIRAQRYIEKGLERFMGSDIVRVKVQYAIREAGFGTGR